MIQNVVVAGSPRSPHAFGLHLNHVRTLNATKVSKTLMKTERLYPGVGVSLIPVFNPAGFRIPEDEADFWQSVGYGESKQKASEPPLMKKPSTMSSEPM